jgi:hypothetical protein
MRIEYERRAHDYYCRYHFNYRNSICGSKDHVWNTRRCQLVTAQPLMMIIITKGILELWPFRKYR